MNRYMTINEAAELLRLSPNALRKRCNKGARKVDRDIQAQLRPRQGEVAQHGEPYGARRESLTFAAFVAGPWRDWATRHKPSTRERFHALLDQGVLSAFWHLRLDEIGRHRFRSTRRF